MDIFKHLDLVISYRLKPLEAERLRSLMRDAGVSPQNIARRLRVQSGTVYNWLNGRSPILGIYVSLIERICKLPKEERRKLFHSK